MFPRKHRTLTSQVLRTRNITHLNISYIISAILYTQLFLYTHLQEVQAHEVAAARAAIKETEAEEKLRSGLAELDMVERMARRQLAAMRWRQAMILQGSAHKQSLFRLPSAHGPCPQPVLQQVLVSFFP